MLAAEQGQNPDTQLEVVLSDPWALARYQVIAAYVALFPARGHRGPVLAQLAAKSWVGPDGELFRVSAETIRVWARRYRKGGIEGLADARRPSRGVTVLSDIEVAALCALKREVSARSLDRLIRIAEDLGLVVKGKARRSTVHRVLQAHGLSGRGAKPTAAEDLDRFEADFPNELWQSDMVDGPWLPDPEKPGSMRKSWLYSFLDDHSRFCLHGRFSFKGDSPALEIVFRRSMQKYGVPKRVYYDNGATYTSHHMKHIVACMGIAPITFTEVKRPQGHGKIEAFNHLLTNAFVAEVAASGITTLDALNEAWLAWVDLYYNDEVHGETGEKPRDRWRKHLGKVNIADEGKIRQAFLWTENRTADKSGVFSLFGTEYQVGPTLAGKRFEVRYDPEHLVEVEAWHNKAFVERVRPFSVKRHRRAQAEEPVAVIAASPTKPVGNWLGHLVRQRREKNFIEPTAQMLKEAETKRREAAVTVVIDVLLAKLDPAVVDASAVRATVARFGPWDADRVAVVLDAFLTHQPRDLHVQVYLDHVHTQLGASS